MSTCLYLRLSAERVAAAVHSDILLAACVSFLGAGDPCEMRRLALRLDRQRSILNLRSARRSTPHAILFLHDIVVDLRRNETEKVREIRIGVLSPGSMFLELLGRRIRSLCSQSSRRIPKSRCACSCMPNMHWKWMERDGKIAT